MMMFVNMNDKFHLLCDIVGVPADGEESQGGEACTKLLANMMIKIMIIFKIIIKFKIMKIKKIMTMMMTMW